MDRARLGSVPYLNARPLHWPLRGQSSPVELSFDVPSRLAQGLRKGYLEGALVSSFECFQAPGYRIVPDISISSRGPVGSVKLYLRKKPGRLKRLALDSSSLASTSMARCLLKRKYGAEPVCFSAGPDRIADEADADGYLLIGDIALSHAPPGLEILDLGEEWTDFTGLPFIYAFWLLREGVGGISGVLHRAKEEGLKQLEDICRESAPELKLPYELCLDYLRNNIRYGLGREEVEGLELYYRFLCEDGMARPGLPILFAES